MPEITYTKKQHIAYMTINHPEKMNAMTSKMRQQWEEALVDFKDDPEMRVGTPLYKHTGIVYASM